MKIDELMKDWGRVPIEILADELADEIAQHGEGVMKMGGTSAELEKLSAFLLECAEVLSLDVANARALATRLREQEKANG